MALLDLELQVTGYEEVDSEVRRIFRVSQDFSTVPHSAQALLTNTVPTSLVYQVKEAVVKIDRQWVASIEASSLIECTSAMTILWNEIQESLNTRVVVEVKDWRGEGQKESLSTELSGRESQIKRKVWFSYGIAVISLTLSAVGVVAAFITCL